MTEKRFEVVMNEFGEVEYIMDKSMMEDRDFAEFIDFVEDVCKENEQLRTKNNAYIQDIEVFKEENTHLKLENEQLKNDVYDWKASAEDYLKLGKSLKKEIETGKQYCGIIETDLANCADNRILLYEENRQLKEQVGFYKDFQKDARELEKENEELAEETKLHKERISLLSSLLDLADAIIDTSDNEKAKQVWDNKNEQIEKEWEKILND